MNDYLGRLVEKNLGSPPAIRPRRPEPFERLPLPTVSDPFETDLAALDGSPPVSADAERLEPGIARRPQARDEPLASQSRTDTRTVVPSEIRLAAAGNHPSNSLPAPGVHPLPAAALPGRPSRQSAAPTAAASVDSTAAGADQAASTPLPSIRVTIGRIEVRTIQPTGAAAAPQPMVKQVVTLEEYLKNRRESRHE